MLVLISLLGFVGFAFAKDEKDFSNGEMNNKYENSRSSAQNAALDEVTFPEDKTPRFSVKELQIHGNNLILTTELLEKLPLAYIVSTTEEDKPVKEIYDFRVLHDVVHDPNVSRAVSLKTIQGLTKYILSVYQEKNYAGIYVYVPADTLQQGTELVDEILSVHVLEGRIAQISVERYDFDRQPQEEEYLKSSVLKRWSPVREGDVIPKKRLDDFVRLLNLNPDRFVSPVISRGTEPNALNLSYDVYEANPWHWYIQVENSGTRDRQWSPRLGLINTNLAGVDDRFSVMYQAPWEKGIEDEYAVFGSYDFPIFSPRLRLNLYTGYSKFDISTTDINFLGNGSFFGSVLSYNILQMGGWFVDLTGSLSRERSKVTPSLGLASDVDMDLWGAGVNIHRSNEMSNTSLTFNRSESMGGSSRSRFEDARIDADPDFVIYNVAANHARYLDRNKVNRISGSFRFIRPNERLVPAKMTTFGGLYSVRGYEEDEIVADGGLLASVQYEFDLVKFENREQARQNKSELKEVEKPLLRKAAPLVFVDFGRAKIKDPVAGEREVRKLCSAGLGMIIEIGDDFSAQIYAGWALRGTEETEEREGRLNASFIKRF